MESATDKTPLERAKNAAGGPGGLARLLGKITPQAISQWRRVPAQRVLDVEKVTAIPRHQLRPDIFPEPEQGRSEAAE